MKLIDNWRQWPRMYSQWAFATILLLQTSVLTFLNQEQLAAPVMFVASMTYSELFNSVTAALAVSGFVGRLLSQSLPKE